MLRRLDKSLTRAGTLNVCCRSLPGKVSQHRAYAKPADLAATLQQKEAWDAFPDDIQRLAVYAEHARAHNYQIPLLSKATADLDHDKAYHVTAATRALRESTNGEVIAGRKLAFADCRFWRELGVTASSWSYVYRNSVVYLPEAESLTPGKEVVANIGHLSSLEPRIETNLLLGDISRPLRSSMSDAELLDSIGWIAHGFEIVTSIFPGWKFTGPDVTAAFGLHGLLLIGKKHKLRGNLKHPQFSDLLLQNLTSISIELSRNGKQVEQGVSTRNDNPLTRLRHLVSLTEQNKYNSPVGIDEVIATGSLTRPVAIRDGDIWSAKLTGVDLPDLRVMTKL